MHFMSAMSRRLFSVELLETTSSFRMIFFNHPVVIADVETMTHVAYKMRICTTRLDCNR